MNFMNRVIVACCILLCTSVWKISAQDYPFRRADLPVEERVEDLVRRMTLEEKIDLLAGYQDFYLHPCVYLLSNWRTDLWGLLHGDCSARRQPFRRHCLWRHHGIGTWQPG